MDEQSYGLTERIRRVLICSLGSIGRRHLKILQENYKGIDVAVLRSGALGDKTTKIDNQTYYSLSDAMAWNPDAAIIATPASEHLNTALPLARHGIPVLIEKPIGDGRESVKDWEELIQLSASVPMEVGYVLRYDPCTKKVSNYIKKGELGKIGEAEFYCGSWLPNWRPSIDYRNSVSSKKSLGGGVLLEISHEIDLAGHLLGDFELRSAHLSQSGMLEVDVEDQAELLAYTTDRCMISIRLNFCTRKSSRYVRIRGDQGEIYWDLISGRVSLESINNTTIYQSQISPEERYVKQMKQFLLCASKKIKPKCTITDGLKVLEIIKKARSGTIYDNV